MDWKDIAGLVGKAAPLLGGILTGPVGAAITVGGMIASALGTESTPDAVQAAIQSNPEAAIRLAEIEANNRVELEKLAVQAAALKVDEEKAHLADRQDARGRDVELRKLAGGANRRADWMIAGDVAGLIVCVLAIFGLLAFKRDMQGFGELLVLLTTIANFFGLSLRDAHQFEFGSSRGSKEKNAIMAGKG